MPIMYILRFLKFLGSLVLMLILLIMGLIFIIAPGMAANLGLIFLSALE